MTDNVVLIPTDFYTEAGFLKSINMTSHPQIGHTIVVDNNIYTVQKVKWNFDVGGVPVLVQINLAG